MKARVFILSGLLMILGGLAFGGYNIYSDVNANKTAIHVSTLIEENVIVNDNEWEDTYQEAPNMEMPIIEIDGYSYVGKLDIPKLGLSLPVLNESSPSNLRVAPCRYYGSIYANDMVISAHNYRSHFARISRLSQHDQIKFTDMDGNEFIYEVIEIEILKPTDIDLMIHSNYDLTLYTCTVGGASRVTVRCKLL